MSIGTYESDVMEVVCPHCNKHFLVKTSPDKMGIKQYQTEVK